MKNTIKLFIGALAITLTGADAFAASNTQEKKDTVLANLRADLAHLTKIKQEQAAFINCVRKNNEPAILIINCQAYDSSKIINNAFSATNVTLDGDRIIISQDAPDVPKGQGFEAAILQAERFTEKLESLRSDILKIDQGISAEIKSIRFKILTLSRVSSDEELRTVVQKLISDERKTINALENSLINVSTIRQEQENNPAPRAVSMLGFASIGGMTAGPPGFLGGLLFGKSMSDATLIPLYNAEMVLAESIQNEIELRARNLTALYDLSENLQLTEWEFTDTRSGL